MNSEGLRSDPKKEKAEVVKVVAETIGGPLKDECGERKQDKPVVVASAD